MPIIPLTCPMCGGSIFVESNNDAFVCQFCGKPFVVRDAIVQNYISNVTNINADTVNVYTQKDFDIKSGTLVDYCGESDTVVVPDSVKIIDGEAFAGKTIRSVIIPNSVTIIDPGAFAGCVFLEEVTLPDKLTEIFEKTFFKCTSLRRIDIPASVVRIDAAAFMLCESLRELIVPEGVEEIGHAAFAECTSLESIVLPSTIHMIDWKNCVQERVRRGVFEKCKSLRKITIKEGFACLGENMFKDCSALTEIVIPDSVSKWGEWVFEGCTALKNVTLPRAIMDSIGHGFFLDCHSIESVNEKRALNTKEECSIFKNSVIFNRTREEWRRNCLSSCCGKPFSGLIKKYCSNCGQIKDY